MCAYKKLFQFLDISMLKFPKKQLLTSKLTLKRNHTRKFYLPEITTALSTTPHANKTALTAQPYK